MSRQVQQRPGGTGQGTGLLWLAGLALGALAGAIAGWLLVA